MLHLGQCSIIDNKCVVIKMEKSIVANRGIFVCMVLCVALRVPARKKRFYVFSLSQWGQKNMIAKPKDIHNNINT